MWKWLAAKEKGLPSYTALQQVPCRGLPRQLREREDSEDFSVWRKRIETELLGEQTSGDRPGFATFLKAGNGLLQLRIPELEGGCLLVFSTPVRAADYARIQMADQKFEYFCSRPEQVVPVVREFREHAGVSHVALDRCPRCDIFCSLAAASLDTPEKVVQAWKIGIATEIARCRLYFDYAQAAARAGQFVEARDVALELVGHVTMEDPRTHLLLGKLAIQLHDKTLLREARDFLDFLRAADVLEQLKAASREGELRF